MTSIPLVFNRTSKIILPLDFIRMISIFHHRGICVAQRIMHVLWCPCVSTSTNRVVLTILLQYNHSKAWTSQTWQFHNTSDRICVQGDDWHCPESSVVENGLSRDDSGRGWKERIRRRTSIGVVGERVVDLRCHLS